jgi:hypothetical protein
MRQQDLYDTDFYQWTQEQAALLRDGKARDLDWTNLAEELDTLGRSERHGLESRLGVLLRHLLKWRYQPDKRRYGHSWQSTIVEQRYRIHKRLHSSPSLRPLLPQMLQEEYTHARHRASLETHLPLETFPEECPWDVAQVLDDAFFPEV